MVTAARQEVRNRIECSKNVEDEAELSKLREEGREAADFLKTSIMQLASSADGHLSVKLNEGHAGGVLEPIVAGMDLPKDDRKL